MVSSSAFVAEPGWLRTLGQIAGTMLLIELLIALAVVCALMGGLAYAAWWVHRNVLPVVNAYGLKAQDVLQRTEQSGERIVGQVATFHGAQVGLFTGLRVFFFGRPTPPEPTETRQPEAAPTSEHA
jgi:hypothetical protein